MGRIPVPPWLKRYLVPAWNEAHRLGWLVRDYGSAILLGRFETCPVCGDVVREVSFADSSLQYCATCQTGGKPLADRRMSRLLK